ncbi:MAG: hypothetical protein RL660_1875 [Bacteroidota bacterium]|jgi:hypothetical protein
MAILSKKNAKYICIMKCLAILVVLISCGIHATAQDAVNLFKDPRLEVLSKRPAAMEAKRKAEEAAAAAPVVKAPVEKKEKKPIEGGEIQVGKKKVTGSIIQKDGFRVVIYNGNDRNKALAVKNAFTKANPSHRSYLTYNTPNFKVKVGDFDDKKEATAFMKRIAAAYPSAFLIPDQVTIKNIMVR